MVLASFDDSETRGRGNRFVCLAGYLATDAEWEEFSDAWRGMLRKHGIPFLHTADFLAGWNEYRDTGLTLEQRIDVIREFLARTRQYAPLGISVAVDAKAFRALPSQERRPLGDEYLFCFHRILRLMVDTLALRRYNEPVPIMFDDDRNRSSRHYQEWAKLRATHSEFANASAAITFADDRCYYPLQAADALANETARNLRHWDDVGRPADHSQYAGLIGSLHVVGELWLEEDLKREGQRLASFHGPAE